LQQATSYRQSRRSHHAPRTACHEPAGGHADPPLRQDSTRHRPRAINHMPLFRFPGRDRLNPAEIRGPCRTNRQDFFATVLFTTSCALPTTYSPSPRITHHVARTYGADTRVRPYGEITHTISHGPETTGHKLRVTSLFWSWTPAFAGVTQRKSFRHSSQANLKNCASWEPDRRSLCCS